MRACPNCSKQIKDDVERCKFCMADVTPDGVARLAEAAAIRAAEAVGTQPETKTCPYCAEEIKWAAKVCKHCHRSLVAGEPASPSGTTVIVQPAPAWNKGVAAVLSLIIPGAGQIYKGQVLNGLAWLFFTVVGYLMFVVPGIIIHICCIIGASSGDPMRAQRSIG
jgi:TM2 domain-containing membrane protein YozV